jgi:hypothetical protein
MRHERGRLRAGPFSFVTSSIIRDLVTGFGEFLWASLLAVADLFGALKAIFEVVTSLFAVLGTTGFISIGGDGIGEEDGKGKTGSENKSPPPGCIFVKGFAAFRQLQVSEHSVLFGIGPKKLLTQTRKRSRLHLPCKPRGLPQVSLVETTVSTRPGFAHA